VNHGSWQDSPVRERLVWAVSVPLMVGGSWAAHVLDYRLVVPNPTTRGALLAATGHGYGDWLPLVIGMLAALALVAAGRAATCLRAHASAPVLWPFLLLPPLAFTFQEHLERLVATGHFPSHTVLDRTFLPGIVLQLPFGVAAYVAAKLALGAVRRLALLGAPRLTLVAVHAPVVAEVREVPRLFHAGPRTSRGPPVPRS
jgi:hypothetical protein